MIQYNLVEAEKASADRKSGGVGASTLVANRVEHESESAKKVRHRAEMSSAASLVDTYSPRSHDVRGCQPRASEWEYVKG